jgi:hypothetical protein
MTDFSVDLNQLLSASRSWNRSSGHLADAAHKASSIQYSNRDVVWALFQEAWDAQVAAAQYMYDRLSEGRDETQSIADVLLHVAEVYLKQDQSFANALIKLDEG